MSILDALLPQSPPDPKGARRIFGYASIGPITGRAGKNARNRKYWQRNRERLNASRRGA